MPDDLTLSEYDAFTVGETPFTHDAEELAAYVLPKNKELNMVFQFQVMDLDHAVQGQDQVPLIHKEWNLAQLKEIVARWQTFKRDDGFWNACVSRFILLYCRNADVMCPVPSRRTTTTLARSPDSATIRTTGGFSLLSSSHFSR